jgi:hypothetical protein
MKNLAVALAVLFTVVGLAYLLPNGPFGHHVKHAVIFLVLAVLSLVWLRFQSRGASAPGAR